MAFMLKQRLLTSVFLAAAILPAAAYAQDAYTGNTTQVNLGTVVVTGVGNAAANTPGGGQLVNEDSTKQVSTVTRTYMQTQQPSANPFQLVANLPSVNAQSVDGFGGVGGSLNVRGFDSSEMGFTIEGVPVNDSGNYAVYPQEYVDNENLDNIFLSQGSVDLNAPHIGASGGNVGISMIDPSNTAGGYVAQGLGNFNERRSFLRIESGLLPTGTKFYVSGSFQEANKWRGEGNDDKYNIEAKLVQQLPHDSTITGSFLYVWEKNYSYLALTKAQWQANQNQDYDATFGGVSDTNYYKLHVNPFRNIITTVTGDFALLDNLHLTIQPYFWYGFGNGGGATDLTINPAASSTKDTNSFGYVPFAPLPGTGFAESGTKLLAYDPSITTTYRPGIINTLTYSIANQTISGGYWFEQTHHKQTGTYSPVSTNGNGGYSIWGTTDNLLTTNGQPAYRRNWLTENTAQEFFLTDDATWLNGAVNTYAGLRTPNYARHTDNEEYAVPAGAVKAYRDYNDILPYVGASYNFNDANMVYADFAGTFRAPQNYAFFDNPISVKDQVPEEAFTTELGYRYQTATTLIQTDAYTTHFSNRQGSVGVDPEDLTAVDHNIGATQDYGVEFNGGFEPMQGLSLHVAASYDRSIIQDNLAAAEANGITYYLPTKGKQFPDTPEFQASLGADYQVWSGFTVGANVKYIGTRYSTYMNDEATPAYYYAEFHADYHLPAISYAKDPVLQFNVTNPFSFNTLGVISSQQVNAQAYTVNGYKISGSAPTYDPLSPATYTVTLSTTF
jgi:iron complex outermembrane receptor protein